MTQEGLVGLAKILSAPMRPVSPRSLRKWKWRGKNTWRRCPVCMSDRHSFGTLYGYRMHRRDVHGEKQRGMGRMLR
jgi:hypothetical protein